MAGSECVDVRPDGRLCGHGDGGTPCDVLLDPRADIPQADGEPDHVCRAVCRASVSTLTARWSPPIPSPGDLERWRPLWSWPAPAGADTLREFAQQHCGLGKAARLPPSVSPLITVQRAWLGLVVARRVPAGMVRLLGLMRDDGDDWFTFIEPVLQTERTGRPRAEGDSLNRVERDLYAWYAKSIAGLRLAAGGAPRSEDISAAQRAAMAEQVEKAYKRKKTGESWAMIAGNLNMDEKTLRTWRRLYDEGKLKL